MEEGEGGVRRGRGMVGRPFLGKSLRLRGRLVAGAEEMAYLSRGGAWFLECFRFSLLSTGTEKSSFSRISTWFRRLASQNSDRYPELHRVSPLKY